MTMTDVKTITFSLDGQDVTADEGETIWQVAKRQGNRIPHLCHLDKPGYRPDGNCRACMVEVEGERTLTASCVRTPTEGMKVQTATERAVKSREMVFELLLADQPLRTEAHDPKSRFWDWIDTMGIEEKGTRFGERAMPETDNLAPGHRRQSRRLHQLRPVRARLPRGPGQRRHRHGLSRPRGEDRLRLRRRHGRFHLRRMR